MSLGKQACTGRFQLATKTTATNVTKSQFFATSPFFEQIPPDANV
jgi:hypothetical protein